VGVLDAIRVELTVPRIRSLYGAPPLHLLAVLASFALAGYAFFQLFDNPTGLETAIWFIGAIVAHDLIAFPIYSALNFIADRGLATAPTSRSARAVPAINHLRIPVYLSALSLLLFFPLILGLSSSNYEKDSGVGVGVFFDRWLGLCAAFFLGSALIYALRLRRAGRRARAEAARRADEDAAGEGD
jgi:hypothetical protein